MIVVFKKSNCNPCDQVAKWLADNNVEHESINAFDIPEKAIEYKIGLSVPVVINTETNERVRGFDPERLKELIKGH